MIGIRDDREPLIGSSSVSNVSGQSSGAPSSYSNWFGDDGSWRQDPAVEGSQ